MRKQAARDDFPHTHTPPAAPIQTCCSPLMFAAVRTAAGPRCPTHVSFSAQVLVTHGDKRGRMASHCEPVFVVRVVRKLGLAGPEHKT